MVKPPAMLLPLFTLLPLVYAQSVINVTIGVAGSFFDPPSVAAAVNDTVNFIFGGDFHGVTQSSRDAPCSPLAGGFSSGFIGRGADFSGPVQMWSLTILNASAPIFFFCPATRPSSHCNEGMVGSINPPSQDIFKQFVASAKQVTGTPAFSPSLVLSGIGATAAPPITISPAITPAPTTSPPASVPSATPSSTTISGSGSATGPSKSSNHAAVIGGAVGGVLGGIILLLIGGLLWYHCRRRRPEENRDSAFFSYNPRPMPPMTTGNTSISGTPLYTPNTPGFDLDREGSSNMMQKPSLLTLASNGASNTGVTLSPQRYEPGRVYSVSCMTSTPQDHRQSGEIIYTGTPGQLSFSALGPTTPPHQVHAFARDQATDTSGSSTANDSGAVDIQVLAKEVAAVLRHEKRANDLPSSSSQTGPPPKYQQMN